MPTIQFYIVSGDSPAQASAGLQSAFDSLQSSLFDLKLVLNSKKTKWMLFSRSLFVDDSLSIVTLQGEPIEIVDSYKYLGIWLDTKLSYSVHIEHLVKKLRRKIGFLYRNKSCFSVIARRSLVQSLILSVFDYGDIVYMHASSTVLKSLDAVYHSALRFITGDKYLTHHCVLYEKVNWPSLAARREEHCLLFIYKALIGQLPLYLSSLLTHVNNNYCTRSQSHIRLCIPRVRTEQGKTAFSYYAPDKWNKFQDSMKLEQLIPLNLFKALLRDTLHEECTCFN